MFLAHQTDAPKSGAWNFTSIGQRCGGVAACCDFAILATPAERAEGFQRTRRVLYQLRLWHCWCRNVESPRARVVANGVDWGAARGRIAVFGHAPYQSPRSAQVGAEQSESARIESRKSGARIFHPDRPTCSGVAPRFDFAILATPDERGEGFHDEAISLAYTH
jgi:hypothetical protein